MLQWFFPNLEDWLRYGNRESLALFIYENPGTAKKLFLRLIPKYIDEYLLLSKKFQESLEFGNLEEQMNSPIFYMPFEIRKISLKFKIDFSLITHIVSICTAGMEKDLALRYIKKYQPNLSEDELSIVSELIDKALNFYNDFLLCEKNYLILDDEMKMKLKTLHDSLKKFFCENDIEQIEDEKIQNYFYEVARSIGYDKSNMKQWFMFLYEALFGQKNGPRFGSFVKIFGVSGFLNFINTAINR